jgi:hypothetical protein
MRTRHEARPMPASQMDHRHVIRQSRPAACLEPIGAPRCVGVYLFTMNHLWIARPAKVLEHVPLARPLLRLRPHKEQGPVVVAGGLGAANKMETTLK